MQRFLASLLIILSFFVWQSVDAKIVLPAFFSDHMVLQQQTNAAIWGWARPGSQVQVTTSWNKKKYSTAADAAGKWKLQVATPVAGGPYEIQISDGESITLKDILIGEVWLCSGQSNMEMPMKGYRDQPIKGSNDAVFNSTNSQIRLYTVPRAVKTFIQDSTRKADWLLAGPETVNNF
ncbi:MAG TPA: 9-O-acetylesterase, partial [Chitinophagaceae bacterium]|nr:9-O-acetylesterase [Chitinophagaceae bacterium]